MTLIDSVRSAAARLTGREPARTAPKRRDDWRTEDERGAAQRARDEQTNMYSATSTRTADRPGPSPAPTFTP